jgi:4'-phosphopantetheinyl transferase
VKNSPDPRFHLSDGEIHVWRASLEADSDVCHLEPLLSNDEVVRANRFRFPEHRRRFVIARGCLRQLVSRYLNVSPQTVAFTYSAEGKPALNPSHASKLVFNVSHSGDIAAFAFTLQHKIGVDVEMVRHDVDVDEIPKRFFSDHEQQGLAKLRNYDKFRGFFNCWARKEAYVKAVGSGLSLPLRDFDVSFLPGEPAQLLATRPDSSIATQWSMASLDFGDNCAAAVVVEGVIDELKVRNLSPCLDQSDTK